MECRHCGKGFATKEAFDDHRAPCLKEVHAIWEPVVRSCRVCGESMCDLSCEKTKSGVFQPGM